MLSSTQTWCPPQCLCLGRSLCFTSAMRCTHASGGSRGASGESFALQSHPALSDCPVCLPCLSTRRVLQARRTSVLVGGALQCCAVLPPSSLLPRWPPCRFREDCEKLAHFVHRIESFITETEDDADMSGPGWEAAFSVGLLAAVCLQKFACSMLMLSACMECLTSGPGSDQTHSHGHAMPCRAVPCHCAGSPRVSAGSGWRV